MPLTGALVTRSGSRPIARASTAGLALALLPLPLAPDRALLSAALVLFGCFAGAMNVSMNAQAVFLEGQYGRPIMSSFHALFSLGGMFGAFLGGLAAARGLQPLATYEIAVPVFIAVALLASQSLLPSDRGVTGQPMFVRITKPLAALGCLAFCILLNEGAMADWSAVYLRRSLRTTEAVAASGYASFSFAMAGGRILGDWLTRVAGRVKIVRFGALLSAAALALGLIAARVPATLGAFLAMGAGFSVIVPLTFGAAGRTGATAGAGLAAVNTAGYIGFLSGPPLIGFTANAVGLRGALWIVVLSSICVSALARAVAIPAGVSWLDPQEPVLQ